MDQLLGTFLTEPITNAFDFDDLRMSITGNVSTIRAHCVMTMGHRFATGDTNSVSIKGVPHIGAYSDLRNNRRFTKAAF
jgi:hypothetical protein